MKIKSLIEEAMAGAGVDSLRQLADYVGTTGQALSRCMRGEGYLKPETMVNLCLQADRDPKLGLAYLGYWKSKGMVKQTYGELIATLEKTPLETQNAA